MQDLVNDLKALESSGKLNGQWSNIPNEVYHHHDCPGLSRSDLVLARRSPKHLKAKKDGLMQSNTTSHVLYFGNLFHEYALENETFWDKYWTTELVPPKVDRRTKAGKEEYKVYQEAMDSLKARNEGKEFVETADLEKCQEMFASLSSVPTAMNLIKSEGALVEHTYFYTCPFSNKLMKFRPDLIIPEKKIIIDLKTSIDASPRSFMKSVANYNYDLQAYMYKLGAQTLFGGEWTFGFVVVEKTEPYGIGLYTAGEAETDMGKLLYKDALAKLDQDPSFAYGDSFEDIGLPAYAFDLSNR